MELLLHVTAWEVCHMRQKFKDTLKDGVNGTLVLLLF